MVYEGWTNSVFVYAFPMPNPRSGSLNTTLLCLGYFALKLCQWVFSFKRQLKAKQEILAFVFTFSRWSNIDAKKQTFNYPY